jgi:hypothetical protein
VAAAADKQKIRQWVHGSRRGQLERVTVSGAQAGFDGACAAELARGAVGPKARQFPDARVQRRWQLEVAGGVIGVKRRRRIGGPRLFRPFFQAAVRRIAENPRRTASKAGQTARSAEHGEIA